MSPSKFKKRDTVRLVLGNPALLMTVKAASHSLVLCAWYVENGRIEHNIFRPDELELFEPAPDDGNE